MGETEFFFSCVSLPYADSLVSLKSNLSLFYYYRYSFTWRSIQPQTKNRSTQLLTLGEYFSTTTILILGFCHCFPLYFLWHFRRVGQSHAKKGIQIWRRVFTYQVPVMVDFPNQQGNTRKSMTFRAQTNLSNFILVLNLQRNRFVLHLLHGYSDLACSRGKVWKKTCRILNRTKITFPYNWCIEAFPNPGFVQVIKNLESHKI